MIISSAAVGFGWRSYQSWRQLVFGHYVFYDKMHTIIENGDSIDAVQDVLGKGARAADPNLAMQVTLANPNRYPEGYEPSDSFLVYELQGGRREVYLQFREGKLVNHVQQDYTSYSSVPNLLEAVRP